MLCIGWEMENGECFALNGTGEWTMLRIQWMIENVSHWMGMGNGNASHWTGNGEWEMLCIEWEWWIENPLHWKENGKWTMLCIEWGMGNGQMKGMAIKNLLEVLGQGRGSVRSGQIQWGRDVFQWGNERGWLSRRYMNWENMRIEYRTNGMWQYEKWIVQERWMWNETPKHDLWTCLFSYIGTSPIML